MDNGTGITPVMNVGGGADALGGIGGFGGIIGLLAVLGIIGNGGLFGNGNNSATDAMLAASLANGGGRYPNAIGYENLATQAQVDRGFDTQNMMANQRETLAAVNAGTAQAVAATNQTFHDSLAAMQGLYNETARDIAALAVGQANALANQNACCCDIKQLIQGTANATQAQIAQANYDNAMRDAATNANFTAQIQSVKDSFAQNKIEALQAQVAQLQLAQATNGMLRFPNSWSYGAGPFPPIFGGCCNGNGNI